MMGTIIGATDGWGGPETGRAAAFDGDRSTFYDPNANIGNDDTWVGMQMPEAYILTEIRILPRDGFLGRFGCAAIWGFNGSEFDPATATLIWERGGDPADSFDFQIIPASEFIAGSNTGFTSFAYFAYQAFGDQNHGDVAEIEFYGYAGGAGGAPAPAAVAAPAAPVSAAPQTFDPITLIAIGTLAAGTGVLIVKKRKR
jgi:hypothetical protein